jgi:hypothetical protein
MAVACHWWSRVIWFPPCLSILLPVLWRTFSERQNHSILCCLHCRCIVATGLFYRVSISIPVPRDNFSARIFVLPCCLSVTCYVTKLPLGTARILSMSLNLVPVSRTNVCIVVFKYQSSHESSSCCTMLLCYCIHFSNISRLHEADLIQTNPPNLSPRLIAVPTDLI